MLLSKEDSANLEKEIAKIIESYTDEINESGKYTLKQRYRATSGFLYRDLMAKNKARYNGENQEEVYREFARKMKMEDKNLKSYELANLVSVSVMEGEPVTDQVGNCAEEIKELYGNNGKAIYCVSTKKGLKKIEPQIKASNYYKAGSQEAIVGASYYEKLMENIVEESLGGTIERAGKYIIYPKNPFKEKSNSLNKIELNREVFVYEVDQENFEPVVNYHTDKGYNGIIDFDGDWISRSEGEKVKEESSINAIEKDFFESRQVFVQTSNIDVIKQIEYTDDEEEILNILEMLIEEGELSYLNLDYGINVNERLRYAKERSNKRLEIAKETMRLIDAKKIEEYLRGNISYSEEQIKEFKQIEIEAEDTNTERPEADGNNHFVKRINNELMKIDSLLGLKAMVLSIKDKKKLEEIEKNGSEKDIVNYYVDKMVGKSRSKKEKSILSDLLYFQTREDKEEVQKRELEGIKDTNTDLLNLIYFKENGISEKSIYSFIIDRCDDDAYMYKDSINRLNDIVEKDAIKQIESDLDRYVISRRVTKQFESHPNDFRRTIKQFFNKKGKTILDEQNHKNIGNIERDTTEKKSLPTNNSFSKIKLRQKDIEKGNKTKEALPRKKKREDIDI